MLFYMFFSWNRRREAISLIIKFVQTKYRSMASSHGSSDVEPHSGFKTDVALVEHDCTVVWRISSDVPSSRESNDGQLIRDFTIETQGWIFWSRLIHLAGSNSPAIVETAGEYGHFPNTFHRLFSFLYSFFPHFLFRRKVRQGRLEPGEIEIVQSQPQSEYNIQ